MASFGFVPNRLYAKFVLVQRAINAQFDCKRLGLELHRSGKLARALRQNVEQSLLQSATLVALPLFIVIVAEVNDIFARDVSRSAWRRKHFTLHHGFDFTGNFDQKFFGRAARVRLLVDFLENVVGRLAVNPVSN